MMVSTKETKKEVAYARVYIWACY